MARALLHRAVRRVEAEESRLAATRGNVTGGYGKPIAADPEDRNRIAVATIGRVKELPARMQRYFRSAACPFICGRQSGRDGQLSQRTLPGIPAKRDDSRREFGQHIDLPALL